MKTKHTPGPWFADEESDFIYDKEKSPRSIICQFFNKYEHDFEKKVANAKIIAAAPNLLEALNECIAALKYAAFNDDGSKLENLPEGIMDSTAVSHTCLIAVRNSLEAIKKATE